MTSLVSFSTLSLLGLLGASSIHALDTLAVDLHMNQTPDDRVRVVWHLPNSMQGQQKFRMPAVVPGTYSVYNFGRFVKDLRAYRGAKPETPEQEDQNTWLLKDSESIDSLVYWVDDTFDDTNYQNWVFEPAGTNFEEGKNFLLNFHGLVGYVEGFQHQMPYVVSCWVPTDFRVATGLEIIGNSPGRVRLTAQNYHQLVDGPAMFCKPDMVTKSLGSAEVTVAVYNPSGRISAEKIMDVVSPVMEAIYSYLGDSLPVDKYAFIFYLVDQMRSPGAGALEHGNSSVYYLPVLTESMLLNMVRDVAAHEFFHIVTPLNLHSEDIHYFDYHAPTMSKHLWLYEGGTEYSSGLVQVRHGLMDGNAFLDWLREKVVGATAHSDNLPFTELSEGCLDEHKEEYGNVYQKGALINACLDLVLRHKGGNVQFGYPNLIEQLSEMYGPSRPFPDDSLFILIRSLGHEHAADFLERHVAGPAPLPLKEIFDWVGVDFRNRDTFMVRDLGFDIKRLLYDGSAQAYYVSSSSDVTELGKKLGIKEGTYILEVGGISLKNKEDLAKLKKERLAFALDKPLDIRLGKQKKSGMKSKQKTLKPGAVAWVSGIEFVRRSNPTQAQETLWKAWLNL